MPAVMPHTYGHEFEAAPPTEALRVSAVCLRRPRDSFDVAFGEPIQCMRDEQMREATAPRAFGERDESHPPTAVAVQMTCHVPARHAIQFDSQNVIRPPTAAFLDPFTIKRIAASTAEVLVGVEACVAVAGGCDVDNVAMSLSRAGRMTPVTSVPCDARHRGPVLERAGRP